MQKGFWAWGEHRREIYKSRTLTMYSYQLIARLCIVTAMVGQAILAAGEEAADCMSDADCESIYRVGSTCRPSGKCSNPFASGCLNTINPELHRIRHCNSDDDDDDQRNCRRSLFKYPEIRIDNQDWDVAVFFSWICQIFLSEVLDVPVAVGLGENKEISSFYSNSLTLPYASKSYAWNAIRKANEVGGNCLLTDEECVHLIPDVWLGQRQTWEQEYRDGQLDYLDGNGQVGKTSWYVPMFTALRHPFTLNYLGMAEKGQELAEIFKRPTKWVDYCHEVSTTNCSDPDEYAERYPPSNEAKNKYFADGYIGHFRATENNNCTGVENSQTCTGHIVNVKCSWSTFLESQAYWNNISLESNGPDLINGGYNYEDVLDIWYAANATRSDIIMWWFEPEFVVQSFRNTDFAFTRVLLPSPSLECREARVSTEDRCSADVALRRGDRLGSCDENSHVTKKAIAKSLRDMTFLTSEVDRSPAYEFIRSFNMDELEISHLLQVFVQSGRTGYAAREAVCEWVADNADFLSSFVPPGYPRTIKARNKRAEASVVIAVVFGGIAVVYVLVAIIEMYRRRKMRVFLYAQVQFIFAVLVGLLLVAIGSILYVIEPNQFVCSSQFWLVTLGYTMELVPLIIKVSALNQLMRASRKMRRVVIKPGALYTKIAAVLVLVTIGLIAWTVVDPPSPSETRTLGESKTVVFTQIGCLSSSRYWTTIYYLWEGMLVLVAFALAFQSRKAKAEFNESKSLGLMIYSHFVFSMLRVVVFNVFDDDIHMEALATSFLLSVDVILGVSIYLLPKFSQSTKFEQRSRTSDMLGSSTVQQIQERAAERPISGWQKFTRQSMRVLFGATNNRQDADDSGKPTAPQDYHAASIQDHRDPSQILRRNGSYAREKPIDEEEDDRAEEDAAVLPLPVLRETSFASAASTRVSMRGRQSSQRFEDRMSGSTRRGSQTSSVSSRPSLKSNISKYGRESMRLLFGPTAELEVIVSRRNLDVDVASDLDDLSESSGGKPDVIVEEELSDDNNSIERVSVDKSLAKSSSDDEKIFTA